MKSESKSLVLTRYLALPMGELSRLKAVTERVPSRNLRTFSIFATAYALSGSLIARQLPHRGSQGRLAPPNLHCLTLCAAGVAPTDNTPHPSTKK